MKIQKNETPDVLGNINKEIEALHIKAQVIKNPILLNGLTIKYRELAKFYNQIVTGERDSAVYQEMYDENFSFSNK